MYRTAIAIAAVALVAGCAVIVVPEDGDVKMKSAFSSDAVEGNGQLASEQRAVSADIDDVEISGPMQVTVRVGERASLRVEGDSNLLPLLRTDATGGALRIRAEGKLRSANPLRVTLTTPHLRKLQANGSGKLDVSGLAGDDLALDLNGSRQATLAGSVARFDVRLNGSGGVQAGALASGATDATVNGSGRLQLGRVQGSALALNVRGSGGAYASGTVERLRVRINGSGSADLAELRSRDADLGTNGSGSITAFASDALVAGSNGSGGITVYGNPVRRDISGKHVTVLQ